jgi:hypothetical protein
MAGLPYTCFPGEEKPFSKVDFVMFAESNITCEVGIQLQEYILIFSKQPEGLTIDDLTMELQEPGEVIVVKV